MSLQQQLLYERLHNAELAVVNGNDEESEEYLLHDFDENYYGDGHILLSGQKAEVESVWTDSDNNLNIHVDHPEFEGDILYRSMHSYNQTAVIAILRKRLLKEIFNDKQQSNNQ